MLKPPAEQTTGGFEMESLAVTYFHWKYNQLSSAQKRFTVLFGTGKGFDSQNAFWPSAHRIL